MSADIAIIGGSGLYQVQALTNKRSVTIQTPYGSPYDDIVLGELEGVTVAFLTRHGQGHKLTPSEVPYRANIYALKTLGVRDFDTVGCAIDKDPLKVCVFISNVNNAISLLLRNQRW